MTRVFAGIGSRKAPADILALASRTCARLAVLGWELWTGGADGMDLACEVGATQANGRVGLFLPHAGFNIVNARKMGMPRPRDGRPTPSSLAYEIAERYHPAWHRCSLEAKALHARNSHQVLGPLCIEPVKFIFCWTPCGACEEQPPTRETGGTGQAIRIAIANNVPIMNLARQDALERVKAFL